MKPSLLAAESKFIQKSTRGQKVTQKNINIHMSDKITAYSGEQHFYSL